MLRKKNLPLKIHSSFTFDLQTSLSKHKSVTAPSSKPLNKANNYLNINLADLPLCRLSCNDKMLKFDNVPPLPTHVSCHRHPSLSAQGLFTKLHIKFDKRKKFRKFIEKIPSVLYGGLKLALIVVTYKNQTKKTKNSHVL
jgi:hypothetical protein